MDESRFSISAPDLYARVGTASAPIVIDVRLHSTPTTTRPAIAMGCVRRPIANKRCPLCRFNPQVHNAKKQRGNTRGGNSVGFVFRLER